MEVFRFGWIFPTFTGQKYKYAIDWSLHIVRSEWLYESIEKGFCQDEKQFTVSGGGLEGRDIKTSTPERRSMAGKLKPDSKAVSSNYLFQFKSFRGQLLCLRNWTCICCRGRHIVLK